VLEGTNLKLASVATDLQGVSAQAMLRALLEGQTDVKVLAELAKGRLRNKRAELERALKGRITAHQRFMLTDLFVQLDFLDERLENVDAEIEAQLAQMPGYQEPIRLLDTIPGVDRLTAVTILAEIGVDMGRFPSDRHLTAWAGVAPGNNETGGKQRSGKTRQGNRYLRRILALAAHGAARTKKTYLKSLYYRLKARRGARRAVTLAPHASAGVAIARTILQMIYHMIERGEPYREMGGDYFDQFDKARTAKRLVKRLEAIGYVVQLIERPLTPAIEQMDPAARAALPLVV
jgi:transposase